MHPAAKHNRIGIEEKILGANDREAANNRRLFAAAEVYVIDLMGSPGAGKTALLEATIPLLASQMRIGVVEGDMATSRDAERIAALGVPVVQITTEPLGGACHLEAAMVGRALDRLGLDELDLIFVENVGNLVCPAEFDLGQNARAVVLSVADGEDKPLKYPLAFREADLVLLNKMDLLPHLSVDMAALRENLKQVNGQTRRIELSAVGGTGVGAWTSWVRQAVERFCMVKV